MALEVLAKGIAQNRAHSFLTLGRDSSSKAPNLQAVQRHSEVAKNANSAPSVVVLRPSK
jgi:hypothetical protein